MSKEVQSFTIDEDVKRELQQRNEINASAVVNDYLREFLSATDRTDEEVIVAEIEKQIDEVDEELEKLQEKREQLVARKKSIKKRAVGEREEQREELFEKVRMVPKQEDHPIVQQAAEQLGMKATDVLTEAYDE